MRARLLFAVVLLGCGDPGSSASAPDEMMMMGPGPAPVLDLEGRIVGLDEQPLPGIAVSLCQAACRDTTTGAQGEYSFSGVAPSFYTLRARKPGEGDYAELDFPLYLHAGANPRLLPLVLPRVGPGSPVPPGAHTLSVDAALSLMLDGGALSLPAGGPVSRLAGVRVPQVLYPNFCVPSARVVAMWAFSPTGVTSASPIGVRLSESLGLLPGATVSFIEIDPGTGRPEVAASGAVSQDGKLIQTAMGAGLRRLSWLLVAVLDGGP
jgi:hypothetical protein